MRTAVEPVPRQSLPTLAACVLLAAAAIVLLSGCEETATAPAAALPEVTVATPLVQPVIDWDGYVGQFEAVARVEVRPRVSGYLVDVHFNDGDIVERGQPLFTIDPRPFEAARDEARSRASAAAARLENARTELERARSLVEVQAVSKEEFEALEAAVRTADAELEAARAALRARELDLEFTRVTAPLAGRASFRRVDPGNAVKADDTVLTTIVSIDPIYFTFQGSEALYLKYRRNGNGDGPRPVRIRLQDESVHRWSGTLDFVDNTIDPGTGTIRGRAVVPNPDGFLTPGMFGHLLLQASEEYSGILVPDSAIATRGAERIVLVVDDAGAVAAKTVELGPLQGALRVIRSGLSPNDRVVIEGQQRARPGQPVATRVASIEPAAALADAAAPFAQ